MARRRDRLSYRRFVYIDEPWLSAGVEQLVETAAARVAVTSQHEEVSRQVITIPASHRHDVRFFEMPEPNRPVNGKFEQHSESFPLSPTLQVDTCPSCDGRKEMRCRPCSGRGKRHCGVCQGSGRLGQRSCNRCRGARKVYCGSCLGRGKKACGSCFGEGQVATFEKETYDWWIEERSADQYPPEKHPDLPRIFDEWLKIDIDRVADLQPQTAIDHLGFESDQALEVVARAQDDQVRLEDEARNPTKGQYLFHSTVCSLVPVGYSVVWRADRAAYLWLVGRGELSLEISLPSQLDPRKCCGWLGVGVVVPLSASVSGILAVFLFLSALVTSGLIVSRILRRQPPVRAIGIAHQTGDPTSLLPCLAYLGSYTGRLSVLDRAYTTQTKRLLGQARSGGQSETLAVELADGRKVFFIEIARPHQLSESQLAQLVAALDGLVILEDAPGISAQTVDTDCFHARVRKLAGRSFKMPRLLIDRGADQNLTTANASPDASLPVEAIRAAFVGPVDPEIDWHGLFQSLWHPMERVLGRRAKGPIKKQATWSSRWKAVLR